MKQSISFLKAAGLAGAAIVILAGVYFVANAYLSKNSADVSAVKCSGTHAAHVVTVRDNAFSVSHVSASLCDTLTITNDDATPRLMAFGPHDHHEAYDGITERLLNRGQSLTVTLNQTGTYLFHDHLHDELEGSFTVSQG